MGSLNLSFLFTGEMGRMVDLSFIFTGETGRMVDLSFFFTGETGRMVDLSSVSDLVFLVKAQMGSPSEVVKTSF